MADRAVMLIKMMEKKRKRRKEGVDPEAVTPDMSLGLSRFVG